MGELSLEYAWADPEACTACGACLRECPRQCVRITEQGFAKVNKTFCFGCGKCVRICPAECMKLIWREE